MVRQVPASLVRIHRLLFAVVVASWFVAAPVQAASGDSFDVERMRLSVDRSGLIDTEWGAVPEHLSFDLGVWAGWSKNPLVLYRLSDGQRLGSLINNRVDGAFVGSIGLFGVAQIGLELPLVFYQSRPSEIPGATTMPLPALRSASLADARIVPKFGLLRSERHGIDLALIPAFYVPSGGGSGYAGEQGFTFVPEVAISKAIGGWRFATNLGAYLRHSQHYLNQTIESELTARVGAGFRFAERGGPPVEIDLALSGATSAIHPFKEANQNALEIHGEVAWTAARWLQVFAGPGFGLSHGYGTPDWRVFAGVRFGFWNDKVAVAPIAPPPPPPPPAPVAPPPPPPPPPPAPVVPVVVDGDGDGVPDAEDNCPTVPGLVKYHGCKEPQLATIEGGRIHIIEKVFFKLDKDVIEKRSFAVLSNVAQVINAHPEIKKLRVEGHTDNRGKLKHNMELSQRRAEAVVHYLVGKGVAAQRLTAKGFGPTVPIDSNKTNDGRANNRRVEFNAVDMSSSTVQQHDVKAGSETREK
jgi:outer membrane protein OmpA-like peptidoglycan-associated protein